MEEDDADAATSSSQRYVAGPAYSARLIMTARTATDPTAPIRITVVQRPVRGTRFHESRSASRQPIRTESRRVSRL
jgi:hypothetical protein